MDGGQRVRLFRVGRDQVVHIPRRFELPDSEAILHKEGSRLIIEPVQRSSLLEFLSTLEPLDETFPEIEDLPP